MMNFTQQVANSGKFFLALLWLAGCAHQVPPTGGPEDKTPPVVVRTVPPNGAVRVPRDVQVEFEFSEKIDRETFPGALFISPHPEGDLKFKFHGRRVRLSFPDSLLPDRTYVLTLGTDLRDNHGVAMAKSYTLAFTTGDSIDHGEISGRVWADKPQGVALWAYILPDAAQPFKGPRQRSGDYITQAGDDGSFRFSYISRGRYRVFAVRDRARNGVYDPGEDEIGIPPADVHITRDRLRVQDLHFRLSREDTVRPGISSAEMKHRSMLEIRFDEPVVAPDTSNWAAYFSLQEKDTGKEHRLLQAARFPLDGRVFYAVTEPLTRAADLRLSATGLTDRAGNPLDSAYAAYDVPARVNPDTLAPRILRMEPADSATNVELDQPIRLFFSEWMDTTRTEGLLEVVGPGDSAVVGRLRWESPFHLRFAPASGWAGRTRYTFRPRRENLRDLAGNALFDTSGVRTFTTLDADTLTEISGSVELLPASGDSLPVVLQLKPVQGKRRYILRLPAPGNFRFQAILPGVYFIDGFLDRNHNGVYDFGKLEPFIPAEQYFVYPDSIKAIPRWPNVGNRIRVLRLSNIQPPASKE